MRPFRIALAALTALCALIALPALAEVKIKEIITPGGFTAWLVEDHGIPFVALELHFRGGTALDAPGKRGAVHLMTALIEEGTGDLDSQGFAEARDSLGASFGFDSSADSVTVSARMLTETRGAAVELLAQAIQSPRLDQVAIDRVREQVLAGIRADDRDPSALAGRAMDAMAFGDHPYATSGEGTVDSVTALTRDDLLAAHAATLARDRVTIAAAGDITAEELATLVDRLLLGLPETGAPLPGRAPHALTGGLTVVDFPSPQSVVLFGHQGIRREDPDFFAAFILNEALGGGRFSSRLMSEVREKRGLTYGIGTSLYTLDQAEMIYGQFSASNDKVAEAIEVIRAEWARIGAEGLTEEELAATKTYLTGAFPLRFDGNGAIANILVGFQVVGLPIDYVNTRNAKIEAVTMEDIARVAARLFRAEDLHFVVAGQPTGL